jgi:hypothetical protein
MTPNERKLNHALRMLAEAGPREAPADVEQALLAAFRSRQRKRKMTMWWSAGSAAAAIAAGIAMFMLVRTAPPRVVSAPDIVGQAQARPTPAPEQKVAIQRKTQHARKARRAMQETAEFYALPDADTGIPLEHATVVRVQMPMSDLRGLGLPINEQRAADRVQADLLLGQDGMARAVRFVQ